jgi:hypothetical protein
MRSRNAAAALMVLLAACQSHGGFHQAEVLPTPLPGVVVAAHAQKGECSTDGCPVNYRVRFTNPMDRHAQVQECLLADQPLVLPLMTIAGVEVLAHATKLVTATALLPIRKDDAEQLVGQTIACTGLDWHGNPPI